MKILITGATGFIGCHLCRIFSEKGVRISGAMRDPERTRNWPWLTEVHKYEIGGTIPREALAGVDAIVHLAHDFRAGCRALNVKGTVALLRDAAKAGVGHQVFFSSYSAHEQATSEYARTKLEIEMVFLEEGHTVVRPGFVLGHGGLYGRMISLVARFPLLPLPGGGQGMLSVISVDDLAEALRALLQGDSRGAFNFSYVEPISLLEILKMTAAALNLRRFFFPVPVSPVLYGLRLAGFFRLPTPVSADNFTGFLGNQEFVHHSNLSEFLPSHYSVQKAILEAVGNFQKGHGKQ